MPAKASEIPVTEFKAKCLEIVKRVHDRQAREIVVTKHGRPYVKVVPVESPDHEFWGCLKGLAEIRGDLTAPTGAKWEAQKRRS